MNNCIKLISKVYLIILIPLASLLIINNILIFAEDKQQQQQNIPIASDAEDLFTFFKNFKNAAETRSIEANVTESSIVKVNTTENSVINTQNHAMSQDAQVLNMSDIPELKENLIDVKESLADEEVEESLKDVTDIENQFILFPNKTTFTGDFQKIKEAIAKTDFNKALDYITKIQTAVIKAETEVFKVRLIAEQEKEVNEDVN